MCGYFGYMLLRGQQGEVSSILFTFATMKLAIAGKSTQLAMVID